MNYKNFLRPGNGATDTTPLLNDGKAYTRLIDELIGKFEGIRIDKVVCVEGRGFLLGAPVAYGMKAGLVPVRVRGKLKNPVYWETFKDYSGKVRELEIHKDAVKNGERVIVVDDWIETGETVKAAIRLVEKCGGSVVGVGAFMDDSSERLKEELRGYNYMFIDQVNEGDIF